MADDSTVTPRTLIKDLLEAKVTQNALSAGRRRSLRQSSVRQSPKPVSEDPVPEPSTVRRSKRRSSFSDVTPRSAIQKFLESHETAKPETRKRKRIEENEIRGNVGSYVSLSSQRRRSAGIQTPVIETPGKNLTPKTIIAGFLRQAVTETPVQSQRESDGHTLPPIPPEPLLMVEDSPLNITAHPRPRRSPRMNSAHVAEHSVQFDFTLGSIAEGEDEDRDVVPESQPLGSPEREQTQGRAPRTSTPRADPHESRGRDVERRKSLRSSGRRGTDRVSVDSDSTDNQWEPSVVSGSESRDPLSRASARSSRGVETRWKSPRHSRQPTSQNLSSAEHTVRDTTTSEEETEGRDRPRMSAVGERTELSVRQNDNQGEQRDSGDSVTVPEGGEEASGAETAAATEIIEEESMDLHISDDSDDKDGGDVEGENDIEEAEDGDDDVAEGNEQIAAIGNDTAEDEDKGDYGENDTAGDEDKADDGEIVKEDEDRITGGDNDIEESEEQDSDGGDESVNDAPEDHRADRNAINPQGVNSSRRGRSLAEEITTVISEEHDVQIVQHDLPVLGDSPSRLEDSPKAEDVNSRPAMDDLSAASDENSGEESTPSHRVQRYVQVKTPSTVMHTTPGKMLTPTSVSRLARSMTSTPKPVVTGKQKTTKRKERPEKKIKTIDKLRMPTSLTKGIFCHFLKANISKDVMNEVEKIADKYWTHLASDLGAFAKHAGRVTVTEEDVELLMKRQGFATDRRSMYTLVEQYLPLEYKQEIVPMARAGNAVYPRH